MQLVFKALADPTRREILNLLQSGPRTAGEISERFPTTGATVSHHLALLREAGLIDDRRQGKFIQYRLNTSVVEDLLLWFENLRGEQHA